MDEVIIYGSGNMGKGLLGLIKNHCKVRCFLDGNPSLRGKTVFDVPVYHPDDIGGELPAGDSAVLLAMTARPFSEMKKMLSGKGFRNVFPAADYAAKLFPGEEMAGVWNCGDTEKVPVFSDERSDAEYREAIRWFSRREDKNFEPEKDKYFPDFMLPYISKCRTMLETGALDGGFINRFLDVSPDGSVYSHILTPASVTEEILKEKFSSTSVTFFPFEASDRSGTEECRRYGIMYPFNGQRKYSVPVRKIDDTMKDIPFDYLRCYSIGKILPVLCGAENSIKKYRPVISANIIHYKQDFSEVPQYLSSVCSGYEFYFRLHSYQGNDGIIYAVPNEMIK